MPCSKANGAGALRGGDHVRGRWHGCRRPVRSALTKGRQHACKHISLADKTVLVTGASSGLGAHFARLAQAAGARVVLAARRVERLQVLAEALQANGGEALAIALDVTRRDSVEQAFDQAEARFGVVDVIINNAGIGDPGRFLDMKEQDWQRMLSTNLDGVFAMSPSAQPSAWSRPGSRGGIVNIASILGLRVGGGLSHYCTAKAAVVQLTKAMALELARYRDPRQCHCPRLLPGPK